MFCEECGHFGSVCEFDLYGDGELDCPRCGSYEIIDEDGDYEEEYWHHAD